MKVSRTLLFIVFLTTSILAESQIPPPPPPPSGSGKISKADSLVNDGDIRGAREKQTDSAYRNLYISVKSNPAPTPIIDPDRLNLREDKRCRENEASYQQYAHMYENYKH